MAEERDHAVERLLEEELTELAKTGARVGSSLSSLAGWGGGLGRLGVSLGGKLGVGLGAKLSRTERAEGTFRCAGDRKDLLLLLYAWFAKNGRLAGETDPRASQVMGVFRGGFLSMNPVVLCVVLREREEGEVEARVEAFAKEGLISQHTAEKAVARFVEDLDRTGR
jgi:hypothetical protein